MFFALTRHVALLKEKNLDLRNVETVAPVSVSADHVVLSFFFFSCKGVVLTGGLNFVAV